MTALKIELSEQRLAKLKGLAEESGTTPEALLQRCVEEWLSKKDDFERAAAYVLQKNRELYKRLA